MIKVFLVEDDALIREGLRNSIAWSQLGYELVGDASDGEMALSMIRKHRPDVLITDIDMPFMDGLSLGKIVSEEFPNIRILIISECDDFEYARKAIEIGVEQYILKPVTKAKLTKALTEVKGKIEKGQEQSEYQLRYKNEIHEYEQFSRRVFFELILKGKLSASEIYEEASRLELAISAPAYNLLLLEYQEKDGLMKEEELLHFFLRNPQYIVFRLTISSFGILIMADLDKLPQYTEQALEQIKQVCESAGDRIDWYVAVGTPVERLSMLSACYQKANKCFSYRFVAPGQHILQESWVADFVKEKEEVNFGNVQPAQVGPEIIRNFLMQGEKSKIGDFVDSYFQNIQDALESRAFRDYILLNIRFTLIAFAETMGCTQDQLLKQIPFEPSSGVEDIKKYFTLSLKTILEIRDKRSEDQTGRIIRIALDYIEEHYTDVNLSLNSVATRVHVSANYFSAIFSQTMKMTFVEYVTEKRMEKAKALLKNTDILVSEIAGVVGYKDSHYFSSVFKKTQGLSPREYRAGKKN
ncbi:MAG: response regulator [Lachnospiraceae bacterium]